MPESRRADFPIFNQTIHGQPLAYLDSAATTQKPSCVLEAIQRYYAEDNANVHRGIYTLSQRATASYEAARQAIRHFINASCNAEIVFTKGATDAINLVASSFGDLMLMPGDEVLISTMEHHSNIVPWQVACERHGATLKVIPMHDNGTLDLEAYERLLTDKTKLVSVVHVSNVLGTINPIEKMIALAHAKSIPVLIDGAQAIAHVPVDVQALDCDFYVFSGHKAYAPTGIGVLYAKESWLQKMPPYQTGGDMIKRVTFEKTEYNVLPHKFEAGTPDISGVVGLGEAVQYIQRIGFDEIRQHENALLTYATAALKMIPGMHIIADIPEKFGAISFTLDAAHPHDISTILDQEGVAVRAGHHCAMPLMDRLGLPATARLSFGIYNTIEDVDQLLTGLEKVNALFGVKQ